MPALLATTSVAALLLGAPLPAGAAGISVTGNANKVDNPANTTVTSIIVNNANVSGAVTNEGTVTPGKAVGGATQAISITNSTIGAGITNSGTITTNAAAGAVGVGIGVNGGMVSGGLTNSSTLSVSRVLHAGEGAEFLRGG
jgi:hypothetical protein